MYICIYVYRCTYTDLRLLLCILWEPTCWQLSIDANMLAIINYHHVRLTEICTISAIVRPAMSWSTRGMCVFTSTSCRTYVLLYQTRLSIYTRTDSHARARTHVYTHNTHNSTHVLLIIFVSSFRISNSLFRTHVHMHNTWWTHEHMQIHRRRYWRHEFLHILHHPEWLRTARDYQ